MSIRRPSIIFWSLFFLLINQGLTQWQAQDPGFPEGFAPVYLSVVEANVVWVVGGHEIDKTPYTGFSKTTDGGLTWHADTIEIEDLDNFRFTSIFALNDSIAWVTMVDDISDVFKGRILKTTDGGQSWQHQSTAYPDDEVLAHVPTFVYFFDGNNGFTVGYYGEHYTTSDGGNLWTAVASENIPTLINNERPFNSNVWPLGDSTAWYGTSKGRVFKTTNRGQSWTAFDVGLGESTVFASFKDELNGLAVTPIINRNIARTTDGGETWITLPNQLPINALLIYIKGTENTYMFGSGDLPSFIDSDPGSGFTLDESNSFIYENDMPLDPLHSVSPSVGWAVSSTYDKNIYKWIGPHLNEIPEPKDYYELDIVYTPPGFFLGDFSATLCIPKQPNGVGVVLAHGAYSAGPFQRATMKIWCDTLAANGYTAMAIDYYNIDVSLNEEADSNAAYPHQATTLKHGVEFLRKNADRFNIFTDKIAAFGMSGGSIHWSQAITYENDDGFFNTDPSVNDHIDAAILLYGLYDTYLFDNEPQTLLRNNHFILYPELAATKGNPIVNTANIDAPIFLAHGTADANVPYQQSVNFYDSLKANGKSVQFKTYDGLGHVFELSSFFPPHEFTEDGLQLKNQILAFLDSTLLDIPDVIEEKNVKTIQKFALQQNYPNPFNPTTKIWFNLDRAEWVTIDIINIAGQKIKTIADGNFNVGKHRVNFDGSGLATGLYFYRMKAGNFTDIKKMVLIK